MNVYILLEDFHEDTRICGVFSSQKLADDEKAKSKPSSADAVGFKVVCFPVVGAEVDRARMG